MKNNYFIRKYELHLAIYISEAICTLILQSSIIVFSIRICTMYVNKDLSTMHISWENPTYKYLHTSQNAFQELTVCKYNTLQTVGKHKLVNKISKYQLGWRATKKHWTFKAS